MFPIKMIRLAKIQLKIPTESQTILAEMGDGWSYGICVAVES